MKKLMLLVLLSISTIAMSDDIVGFNFGGDFTDYSKYQEVEGDKVLPHEYIVSDVKFFDVAQVGTDENKIIKSLSFQKSYTFTVNSLGVEKRKIHDDFKKMLQSIENRYGAFDKSKASNILGRLGDTNSFYMGKVSEVASNTNPKSKTVGGIFLVLEGSESQDFMLGAKKEMTLLLIYIDKLSANKMKEKRAEEASGF